MKKWTTESIFNVLKDVTLGGNVCLYTEKICESLAPKINEINTLKKEKNAIILAHSYVVPEITRCIADYSGDSYELSKRAKESTADTIIFSAVKFMAETAKLLNPNKTVIIPTEFNGCSLADSITASDIQKLKIKHPNHTFICYINTTAEVKAECNLCVTSSNVYDIVAAIDGPVYFLPDKLMAKNIINELEKRKIKKEILYWEGSCYVHEEYNPEMIEYIKIKHPNVHVLAHPECNESIIKQSDFVGSTSQMMTQVKATNHSHYFMLTECGLTSRLQSENVKKNFVGSCTMCKYMKSNSLDSILEALKAPNKNNIIEINQTVRKNALKCVEEMFNHTNKIYSKSKNQALNS